MIQRLLTLMRPPAASGTTNRSTVAIAAVALLLEIAASDDQISADELSALKKILIAHLPIDTATDRAALIDEALEARHRATCLFEFTRCINRQWDAAQKQVLLQALWHMACADGVVHPREEGLIRKLADLIHVPQGDVVRTRLQVEAESDSARAAD